MTTEEFSTALDRIRGERLPHPGDGATPERHRRLFSVAEEDVSLAKIAEAHWDALSILAEADREPEPGALYGVWASEIPGQPLQLIGDRLSGTKAFASGAGLLDRALVTVGGADERLLDVDLRNGELTSDLSVWKTGAFRLTHTGVITFHHHLVRDTDVVGSPGFYLKRAGFWHGACGPAACWAGGAAGLLRFAHASHRDDPHTMAHRGAMEGAVWAMQSLLRTAGEEIDAASADADAAHRRALMLRHSVDTLVTDLLQRFARAYGPYPLAMHEEVSRRCQEVSIFLRQCHAERDLETLGIALRSAVL